MAPISSTDLLVGLASVTVAAFAIYMFIRASGGIGRTGQKETGQETVEETASFRSPAFSSSEIGTRISKADHRIKDSDVERARSDVRTLTLKRELLTMVLKRLFEAEDDGEITREERLRLSRDYEAEMKRLSEGLKQAELIVTLNELESIRDEILKKFEATLNQTQTRIDSILKELKIEAPKESPPRVPRRREKQEEAEEPEDEEAEEVEEEEDEEEEPRRRRRRRPEVDERLEQLRQEVLKELEELERLEIEV